MPSPIDLNSDSAINADKLAQVQSIIDQMRSFVDQVVTFPRITLNVVQLGLVPIRSAIAVGIANVFPFIRAYTAHVRRVRKLLFVVVLVVPGVPPSLRLAS